MINLSLQYLLIKAINYTLRIICLYEREKIFRLIITQYKHAVSTVTLAVNKSIEY